MKLKPCPFCGGEAKEENKSIICLNCGCQLPLNKDWNKRVLDDNIEYNSEFIEAIETSYERPKLTDAEYDYLQHINKFYNNDSKRYLISPNSEVIKVENEHCKFICDILGLEMNNQMNESSFDFCEVFIIYALFLGYIRINIYKDQIAIQYEVINRNSIDSLFKFLCEIFNNKKCCVVVEKLSTNTSEMFDNLSDAYEHFYSMMKV